jgi:TPR repeat protein
MSCLRFLRQLTDYKIKEKPMLRQSILSVSVILGLLGPVMPAGSAADSWSDASSITSSPQEQEFCEGLDAYHAGDYRRAMKIWLVPARKGHAKSQTGIGYLYFQGLGIEQSDQRALDWYRIAAAQGQPNAQHHMGLIYQRGKAVRRNAAEAYMWCDLAMSGGYPQALYCRDEAARELSSAQIEKAAERGRQMSFGAGS